MLNALALSPEQRLRGVTAISAGNHAALLGPLREPLRGKRVGLIVCGSNIDAASFAKLIGS